jgi:hypothetical protein
LTGKSFGTDVGLLSAVDDRAISATDEHAIYNLLRVQRDLGARSRVGVVYTDRIEGGDYNRVAGADARLLFGDAYSAVLQLAGSRTRVDGVTSKLAPLWQARVTRNGETFGFRTSLSGSDDAFRARSGFFARPGLTTLLIDPRVTINGARGSFIESFTTDLAFNGRWRYDTFVNGGAAMDKLLHLNANTTLRGGWEVGASLLVETFGYPYELYTDYRVELPRAGGGADTVAFTGEDHLPNLDYVLSLRTPEFSHFSGYLFTLWGRDENFFEWASAKIVQFQAELSWRPTDRLRVDGLYNLQQVKRHTDGSMVNLQRIPRLKVEYQVSRPLFVRLVGEHQGEEQTALRHDARTGAPILIFDPDANTFVRAAAFETRMFRGDVLLAYQPNPGTVFFAGYGSTLEDPTRLGRGPLKRTADGFFLKASYLFRM